MIDYSKLAAAVRANCARYDCNFIPNYLADSPMAKQCIAVRGRNENCLRLIAEVIRIESGRVEGQVHLEQVSDEMYSFSMTKSPIHDAVTIYWPQIRTL